MKTIKISYIIVSYNVKEYVIRSIQSVYNYSRNFEFEIIVIDNNSYDGTTLAIKKMFPNLIIIENNSNSGFSQGNNQGFDIANGEYIFMLNPDAELTENAVDLLIGYVENNFNSEQKSKNLLAPYLENTDGTFQKSYWKTPTIFSIFGEILFVNYFLRILIHSKAHSDVKQVDCVSGAAMLFHNSLLSTVGKLDPNLFWMDDTDFCYRIQKNGGKVYFYPYGKVIHHVGKSSLKNQNVTVSNQVISKIKFYWKHKRYFSFLISIVLSFVLVLEKILIFGLFSLVNNSIKTKLKAYIFTLKKLFSIIILNNYRNDVASAR